MQNHPDWRDFFPLKTPRDDQSRALDFIVEQMIVNEREFVVAELGTGVGKSAIAVTLARLFNAIKKDTQSYVLTCQKTLQDQYTHDFPMFVRDIRSSSNFSCHQIPGQSCGETMRLRRKFGNLVSMCNDECLCPYSLQKSAFKRGLFGVTNYSYFLSETTYAKGLRRRGLLVCDEAHNIESELTRWATITFERDFTLKELQIAFPSMKLTNEQLMTWVIEIYAPTLCSLIGTTLAKIVEMIANKNMPPELFELVKHYTDLDKHICQVNRFVQEKGGKQSFFLVSRGKDNFQLKPTQVGWHSQHMLYPLGEKKLLMSATILDKEIFYRSAGLPKDAAFISINTPFSSKSFGISYEPTAKVTLGNVDEAIPKIVAKVKDIIARHPNEKGIIHVTNYTIARAIAKANLGPRMLVQTSAADRVPMLDTHVNSKKPTVLVSPGMSEGLNLVGDLGRFQIICKIPFPCLGDEVIRAKMRKSPRWYAWCTMRSLVQSVGRSVRSNDDWTKTYILDTTFERLVTRNKRMTPQHILDALKR